jgi:hypothetical protein
VLLSHVYVMLMVASSLQHSVLKCQLIRWFLTCALLCQSLEGLGCTPHSPGAGTVDIVVTVDACMVLGGSLIYLGMLFLSWHCVPPGDLGLTRREVACERMGIS